MPKLRLKRTPAELLERELRRAIRATTRKKRRHAEEHDGSAAKYDDDGDDDVMYGPPPPPGPSFHKPDYDAIQAELEEARFRERLWDALEDDERLGGIDARFNDYAHIPDRWSRDRHDSANPRYMDDDEYAEWVREGMWKKKHAREYEEQARRDAEKAAQRARQKKAKAETARLERETLERRERKRKEMQKQQEDECRQRYEHRWKALLDPRTRDDEPLTFEDIPWPLFPIHFESRKLSRSDIRVEDITPEAISAFILPSIDDAISPDDVSKRNRDKLKDTLLRFHPDKFEGRLMQRVSAGEVECVREVVGQVARVLNVLLNGRA